MKDFLEELARETGAFLLQHLGGVAPADIEVKGPRDLVSWVDRTSEERIRERILARFPEDGFLGEEAAATPGTSGRRWIVDPLDGTSNYLHQVPFFCVSIACQGADGSMEAGVLHVPVFEELFLALRGQGATLNGAPLRVSGTVDLDRALLVTGFADARSADVLRTTRLERLLNRSGGVRRLGSAAYDLCNVARGWMDGFFEWNLSPWDVAAGALVVAEAGGMVTDALGGQDWLEGRTIVAAGPGLHATLLRSLDEPLAEDRLGELQDRMRDFVAARGWESWHSPKNLSTALMVEAGELAEIFQWLTPEEADRGALSPEQLEHAGEELADVLAYALSLSNRLGLDLATAFARKMAANAVRYPPGANTPLGWGGSGKATEPGRG